MGDDRVGAGLDLLCLKSRFGSIINLKEGSLGYEKHQKTI